MLGLDRAAASEVFLAIDDLRMRIIPNRSQPAAGIAIEFSLLQIGRATRGQQPELNHQQSIWDLTTACGD